MHVALLSEVAGFSLMEIAGLILLLIIGVAIIVFVVKMFLIFLPATVVALVVWFLTGSLWLAGLAFLIITIVSIFKG